MALNILIVDDNRDTELSEAQAQEFQELLKTFNKEADLMVAIAQDLKRIGMDTHQEHHSKRE